MMKVYVMNASCLYCQCDCIHSATSISDCRVVHRISLKSEQCVSHRRPSYIYMHAGNPACSLAVEKTLVERRRAAEGSDEV